MYFVINSKANTLWASSYMQWHFIKARVQTQHVSLGFKRYGLAVGVVGELFVPESQRAVHVKRKRSFLGLIPGEHRRDTLHPCGRGLAYALLKQNRCSKM